MSVYSAGGGVWERDYRDREYYMELTTKNYIVCLSSRATSRELSFRAENFRRQQLTRSFSLSGGTIEFVSLCENYQLVLSTATNLT